MTDVTEPKSGIRWGIAGPAIALLFLVAAYTVYWFIVTDEIRKQVEAFAANPPHGLVTGWSDFSMRGYPYRIAADFRHPSLAAPAAPEQWEWRSDRATVALLPYNLRHAMLTFGHEHAISYRDVRNGSANGIRATVEKAQASYVDLRDLPVGRIAIDVNGLDARHSRAGRDTERLRATRLQLHARPALTEEEELIPAAYDFALRTEEVEVEGMRRLPVLGNNIAHLLMQARLRAVPGTPHVSAVELLDAWRDSGGTLAISDLIVKWGPLDLTANGELALDRRNRPEGRLDARVKDFKGLLDALERDGFVKEEEARLALAGLTLVSQFQGNRSDEILVPVIMREGRLYLGPLAVAELEPLY